VRRFNLNFFESFLEAIDDILPNLLSEFRKNSDLKLVSQCFDLVDLGCVSRSLNHILAVVNVLKGDCEWAQSFVYLKWYPNIRLNF